MLNAKSEEATTGEIARDIDCSICARAFMVARSAGEGEACVERRSCIAPVGRKRMQLNEVRIGNGMREGDSRRGR